VTINALDSNRRTLRAVALVCVATFLAAAIETLGELFAQPHPAQEVVWARYGFHLILLFGFLGVRGRARQAVRTARPALQILRGLLMLGMPAFFVLAASRLSLALVWSEFWIAPLVMLLLAPLLLAEHPGRRQWLVALVAFAGVVLMTGWGADGLHWAELLPLGMAACFGAYVLLSRELSHEPISASLFYTAICPFVPLTLLIPFFGGLPGPRDIALMAAIGGLSVLFFWAIDRACEMADVSMLAPLFFLQPLWQLPLRFGLLGEKPGRAALVGALVVGLALLAGVATTRVHVLGRLVPARARHGQRSATP
jgi:drug/metabolite transporter (DMT)-like permease